MWVAVAAAIAVLLSLSGARVEAQCRDEACLRTAARLASVSTQQSALIDATLNGLLGSSSVDLTVADDTALASTSINLSGLTSQLNQAGIGADATSALGTPASFNVLLQAASLAARAQGSTSAADALDKLRGQTAAVGTGGIKLGDMITADTRSGPLENSPINLLDLVTGSASLFNSKNVASLQQVTVDGSSLGSGIGAIQLALVVVQPATFVCGPQGSVFYSASMRVRARINLTGDGLNLSVAGLTTVKLKLVQLDLVAMVGRASGTLTAVDAVASTLTVQATPGVAELYLGSISDGNLLDRNTPIEPSSELSSANIATLDLWLTVLNVKANVIARGFAIGATPGAQPLSFTGPYPQTLTATTQTGFLGTLVGTLLSNLTVQVDLQGSLGLVGSALTTVLNALLSTVTNTLKGTGGLLAPILNAVSSGLLDPLLSSLGVKLGEVSVTAERPAKVTAGSTCNDNLYCTTDDVCNASGVCTGPARSCDDGVSCTVDTCDETNLRCNNVVQNACRIGGVCYASGASDPSNGCRACTPATSTSSWTTRAIGASCDDGLYCTDVDTCSVLGVCVGAPRACIDNLPCTVDACDEANDRCTAVLSLGCLIGGVCVAAGVDQPDNACRACLPGLATGVFAPKPAGTACSDGAFCTISDACDGQGACAGSARSCSDAYACTSDACNEATDQCVSTVASGCLIGNACIAAGTDDPSNPCRSCNPALSTTSWSLKTVGTACDDGQYCTTGDACAVGGVCTGAPRVCAPGGGCASVCDEASDQCRTNVSGCLIGGACIAPGNVDPSNPCRACLPAASTTAYSNLPAGTGCVDALYCTVSEACNGAGACVGAARDCTDALSCTTDGCDESGDRCTNSLSGCLIGGACVAAGAADPSNPCAACIPAVSTNAYSPRPAGFACDDGQWCTVADACNGVGTCTGTARTCDPMGLGCSSVCDEASDQCRAGIPGCLVGGGCAAPGSDDPSNACRSCQPAISTTSFTNKVAGSTCSDGRFCTSGDACDGAGACVGAARACDPTGQGCTSRCVEAQGACVVDMPGCSIGGSCIAPGSDDPSSPCRACQPSLSTTAYTNKSAGTTCSDGLFCTAGDACNGAGACVAPARDCGDALACTSDACDENLDRCSHTPSSGCVINGACAAPGSDDPSNPCRSCNPALSTTAYSNKSAGASCADGLFCTVGDACDGLGRCASTARDCDDNLTCTRDTCDESNDRCTSTVDDGCLIGGVCRATGSDDPGNPCRACTPTTSTSAWTDEPRGTTCSDGQYCTVADACNGTGQCQGSARSCGAGCSSVCDEALDACRASSDGCAIDGVCVAPGSLDPANPCRACDPATSTTAYTSLSMGTVCDDGRFCTVGDACDGAGACSGRARDCADGVSCTDDTCDEAGDQCRTALVGGGCAIDGVCIGAGAADPLNPCRSCDPAASTSTWTSRPAGYACDDGAFCTVSDACDGEGACGGDARDCNGGAGGCASACDEAADACRSDVDGCAIDGVCLAAGAVEPGNPCRVCDPARSRTRFSDRPSGAACDDGAFCTDGDRCDAQGRCVGAPRDCGGGGCDSSCDEALDDCVEGRPGCAIDGACVAPGARNPSNTCLHCDPVRDAEAWSPRAAGSRCDDGLFCTEGDACDASGACVTQPRDCDDGRACTTDRCDEQADRCSSEVASGCLVQDACVAAGALDPSNPCRSCNPGVSVSAWTNLPAAVRCDDGQFCTVSDGCDGEGSCAGALRDCGGGAGCASFCDEARDACRDDVPGCAIGQTCLAIGTVDPRDPCRACDPALSTTGWSPRPVGSACEDGLACTRGDACGADGRCVGSAADCSDARSCTVDLCDEAGGGCQHSATNGCLIDQACVPAGASASGNACAICDPARSPTSWSPAPAAIACDDGLYCTPVDRCDGGGRCVGSGGRCASDGLDCTLERCDEASRACVADVLIGCAIGNQCWPTGATSDADPCLACLPSRSTTSFSPDPRRPGCDSDGDGLLDGFELGPSDAPRDTDADGRPDHLDADDDGDGLLTRDELSDPNGDADPSDARDLDGDGASDYLDADDDDDLRDTLIEREDVDSYGVPADLDGDGTSNWHDLDTDGDRASDWSENVVDEGDGNGDDVPDYLQAVTSPADEDGDGLPDAFECPDPSATCADADGDGIPDWRDASPNDAGVAPSGDAAVTPDRWRGGGVAGGGGCAAATGGASSCTAAWLLLGALLARARSRRRAQSGSHTHSPSPFT
ncbi:MAG: hypothetical protein ABW252_08895 [Polyangiales bacterium]